MSRHATQLTIELKPGSYVPRYTPKTKELRADKAVITENGMESKLPLVDFQLTDEQGNTYFFALTGRILINLAAAIRGVNLRNHGAEEL